MTSFRNAQYSRLIKDSVKSMLKPFGVGLAPYETLERLRVQERTLRSREFDLDFLRAMQPEMVPKCLDLLGESKSQLRQDLFVLTATQFKTNGFFVEFGATNGVDLSNTYLLEKSFDWSGILAEPARRWHGDLRKNRSASVETRCVWTDSDSTLVFNEVDSAEFSTISSFSDGDDHSKIRRLGKEYPVKTISLLDLLEEHGAPSVIDYLSIDTEGSEFRILESFDFSKYSFRTITCEHNYTPMREAVLKLLTANGYRRVLEDVSLIDDWFILD
jgi:FkbM family methyltransferase